MTIITIMIMIIAMGIQQKQSHGQEQMGRCTIAMMGWHHIHTSPSTLLATSAEELHHSSPGISMKGLLLLASADQLVLGNCPSFNNLFIVAWKMWHSQVVKSLLLGKLSISLFELWIFCDSIHSYLD